jgi:hypothetical protein
MRNPTISRREPPVTPRAEGRSACARREAHHFCRQVDQDFLQCVPFDGSRIRSAAPARWPRSSQARRRSPA